MSYVVLARKYRPMRFEDLVGQEHVAKTLANAIETGRVAHAFLFTGVRGVGKTTSARILAKALNCMGAQGPSAAGSDPGPTATPCLECPACVEIARGTDVDVREIDGASYNGVDEVRKLQDSLPYQPTRDRFKIIIVDEVHMLSQSAWNAFLKTLEEPPPHVKFIFATTEVHKVPITILSRVQRFDFKLIGALAIIERLKSVLALENIQADEEALSLIARQAAGSMRDAMSLLDQVIAWSGKQLVGSDVAQVLGVASRTALFAIAQGLLQGDATTCLKVIAELVEQGYDVSHVAKDLLALLRDMVVSRVCRNPDELMDVGPEERSEIEKLAKTTNPDDLIRLHQGFSQAMDDIAKSGQARGALEMLLVRLCRRPPLIPIDQLIERLSLLEKRLGGRPVPPPGGPEPAPSGRRPQAREHRSSPARTEREQTEEPPAAPERAVSDTVTHGGGGMDGAAPSDGELTEPALAPAASEPTPSAGTPSHTANPPAESNQLALARFRDIVEVVRETRPELAAFLEHAAVLTAEPGTLCLAFEPDSLFAKQVKGADCTELLSQAASQVLQAPTRAEFRFDYAPARGMDTLSADRVRARETRMKKAIADARSHPRVTEALKLFGARLKDLKLSEGT